MEGIATELPLILSLVSNDASDIILNNSFDAILHILTILNHSQMVLTFTKHLLSLRLRHNLWIWFVLGWKFPCVMKNFQVFKLAVCMPSLVHLTMPSDDWQSAEFCFFWLFKSLPFGDIWIIIAFFLASSP